MDGGKNIRTIRISNAKYGSRLDTCHRIRDEISHIVGPGMKIIHVIDTLCCAPKKPRRAVFAVLAERFERLHQGAAVAKDLVQNLAHHVHFATLARCCA